MLIRRWMESGLRARYGFAVVVAGALGLMLLNEISYQHASQRLTGGIQLTDARIQGARALQLLTDAETSVRGYLLTGADEALAPYRNALVELPLMQDEAFKLIQTIDNRQPAELDALRSMLTGRMGELRTLVDLAASGQREQAGSMVLAGAGSQQMDALRKALDEVLLRAAGLQQTTRVSIYDALLLNRLAVPAMLLLALLGLHLYMRQLRHIDNLHQQTQERLATQVAERTAELRELTGHLMRAREDERARLARELHDELGGLFSTMKLDFARLRRLPEMPLPLRERVAAIEQRLNDGIALKRRVVENLRPSALDQLGLVASVDNLCVDSQRALGIPVMADLQPVKLAGGNEAELTIYRTVQEALTNVGKYAQATRVHVRFTQDDLGVRVEVADDGVGFVPSQVGAGHHGLLGMRYRADLQGGKFQVDSAPGRGTRIVVTLPSA